jgi:ribosomal protein S21
VHRWLTPVNLATQEAEIWKTAVQSQPGQILPKTLVKKKKKNHKNGLVEWLKVKALSSNPSTTKKKKKRKKERKKRKERKRKQAEWWLSEAGWGVGTRLMGREFSF